MTEQEARDKVLAKYKMHRPYDNAKPQHVSIINLSGGIVQVVVDTGVASFDVVGDSLGAAVAEFSREIGVYFGKLPYLML